MNTKIDPPPLNQEFEHTIAPPTDTLPPLDEKIEQAKADRVRIDRAKILYDDPNQEEQISMGEISQDWALFRLLGEHLWPYKKWMAAALIAMIIVAMLNVVPPFLLQQAIDGPLMQGDASSLWPLAALYALTAISLYIITYAYTYCLQQAGQRALADLRVRLFNHLLNHDYAFLSKTSTGELVARLTNDIDQLNAVLSSSIVVVLVEGVTLIAVLSVMFAINWRLALLVLTILPIVIATAIYFRMRLRRSSTGERSAMARISSFLNEHLHGMTVVQLFNREGQSEHEFDTYNSRYRRALITLRRNSALFLSVQEIIGAVGLALMLYAGGRGVLAGWASFGVLVAFIQYTQRAFRPIIMLSQQYNAVQVALGAAERIYRMLKKEPDIQDPKNPAQSP